MGGTPRMWDRLGRLAVMITLLAIAAQLGSADIGPTWRPALAGLDRARIGAVAATPTGSNLYAAAGDLIYYSTDAGRNWRSTLPLPGGAQAAWIVSTQAGAVWVATNRGLFLSADGGRTWQRRFQSASEEHGCLVLAADPTQANVLLLGTTDGLFLSRDGGEHWQSAGPRLSGLAVRRIAIEPTPSGRTYALTDEALFASSDWLTWDRLFVRTAPEASGSSDQEAVPATDRLIAIALDPADSQTLHLTTERQVFVSRDRGATWRPVTASQAPLTPIHDLLAVAGPTSQVYVASQAGLFRYDPAQERWISDVSGFASTNVTALAATSHHIVAGTDRGIYLRSIPDASELPAETPPDPRDLLGNFVHEPTIRQVQEATIAYADVDQRMIRRWRRQASLKALLPNFTLGYNRDTDTYLNGIGSTTNPDFDRILRTDDPARSVHTGLSWQLGDLIWNDDQTAIDTRSRLLVQLRDDLLNDATRAYFERRRLQLELITHPPADATHQIEKELRLQELTAILDGLTGGWFSQHTTPPAITDAQHRRL